MNPIKDLPLILVSGQARSGTTILTKAIAAHPQVLSNGKENNWLRDLAVFVQDTFADDSRVNQLAVSKDRFLAHFRGAAYRNLFPEIAQPLDANIKALSTFSSLREDMFEMLPAMLPNALLVNIVRNGIEVVNSRIKHEHIGKGRSFAEHCVAWAHSLDVVLWAEKNGTMKDRLFVVRHEQLLAPESCEEVFSKLQAWLKLDLSPACCRFVQGNFVSQNRDTVSPQTNAGIEKRKLAWQNWNADQRAEFEQLCGTAMNHFGFPIPWKIQHPNTSPDGA